MLSSIRNGEGIKGANIEQNQSFEASARIFWCQDFINTGKIMCGEEKRRLVKWKGVSSRPLMHEMGPIHTFKTIITVKYVICEIPIRK